MIHVVGLGMDPDNLPEHSSEVIEHAQVLCGGRSQLAHFDDHPAEKLVIAAPLDGVIESLAARHAEGLMVVVLADGDPLYYGIGATLVERLGPEEVTVYPGVTALQAAAAKLKIPWAAVETVSLHGRNDWLPLCRAMIRADFVAVYTDPANVPAAVAQAVLDKGCDHFAMWVLEDLETEAEQVRKFTLEEAARTSFSKLNLVLLERTGRPGVALTLGIPDDLLAKEKNLMTKGPVRAAGLSALRITPGDTVWDLGAGCGAVAVEAASLAAGRVLAVEKNANRVGLIRENIRRTGAYTVEPVHGSMPRCLDDLPDPDRVFIGGGLSRNGEVLDAACARLAPGGRLVCHVVLLSTLERVRKSLADRGWPVFVTLVSTAEARPLAGDLHLASHNPVFIVGADKPLEG
ncbi:MAG: precorrin-6y C5,15-methyltransferase (decarboxylating) subunit CbiE [Thermodesulfobacteriota bacterium]